MSSLENITSEAIQCLAFVDSYTKRSGKKFDEIYYSFKVSGTFRTHIADTNIMGWHEFGISAYNTNHSTRSWQ